MRYADISPRELTELLDRWAPLTPVPGVPALRAHQAPDLYALWHALERVTGDSAVDPPFWSLVWPAAVLLARHFEAAPPRGQRVLDLGCGGGVAAMAAARAGAAEVVANDVDPTALAVAVRNAEANAVMLTPCHRDRVADEDLGTFDLVVVGDLFYEKKVSDALSTALRAARQQGAEVLIGDGGRAFVPDAGLELLARAELAVPFDVEGVAIRDTRLLRLV